MPINWPRHRREAHQLTPLREFLKQIVYGGNDGIVTTFAVVAGFAGAASEGVAEFGALAVLVFGFANLFADGVSMGLSEFLSGRSQRDLYRAQHARERRELARSPAAERAELEQILRERGLSREDARQAAGLLLRSPEFVADLMMAYEFEMTDPRSVNPVWDGLSTFFAFISFGLIPLIPWMLPLEAHAALPVSMAATLAALMLLGLMRWWATRESPLRSVGETVLVGTVCAAVAYAAGALVAGFA
ncbi:Predicted Fe2+/Mn2+ transporter, VIT1/CCC1 family [Meinhardsimonia xiamenensis]|jgi:VIT1/CCC1 family predicted Fe2+/Mn2+ transporter|uniref:Predicted Fe2+/Mn2+ transporter, VIT1/CCC1 family n=1 Tax=Meinhardsimonia xiamenensis TaxID=990712 RepID=A0A1G9G1C2_9RHOB|nr:VIT1/CCC1 transporter family protein [Meinhardsimonia xiamenensis]PRX32720.1 VIT1/CCC1 family predicted Fe2+/Mn2+ transporter [Meinhardsimonia xiamenensis]SDK94461.1 Predicted Fe2+/Mn2+ transporter, VIT1/CCC1 family [Meinhardsimonia xiamenensis]